MDPENLALVARLAPRQADRSLALALVPAHDDEERIGHALQSLWDQELQPDAIVVCADRCTDRTAQRAEAKFAHVLEPVKNRRGLAGALNQALDALLPELRDEDAILVMNADSILAPAFLAEARRHMDDGAGGTIGAFTGRLSGGFGLLAPDDHALRDRDVTRVCGEALVLKGAATLFSVAALREVGRTRAVRALPRGTGQIYDNKVLANDDQLTIELLDLGYKISARVSVASSPSRRQRSRIS